MIMAKKPVSLTLDEANVVWLRGRTYGRGNLSAVVDELITKARTSKLGDTSGVRTVVGTIDIAVDDPLLEGADATVRELFAASLSRPARVKEVSRSYAVTKTHSKRNG
jgi:hypothetical protein